MSERKRSAAVLAAPRGDVRVVTEACPEPGPGEVLLRMEACGICHSDLFVAGLEKLPLCPVTLGHEGIGRVDALGSGVTAFAIGDRAGVTFLATTCGVCELCLSGRERFCARQKNSGYTVHGALADWAVLPAQQLARIPEAILAAEAAPLCCAGWTAYGAVRASGAAAGQTIGIFGMGGLGHLALQYARHRGLRTAAVDLSQEKLRLATDLGADITADAATASRVLQKEHGGLDAAVVLTAAPAAIEQAFRSVKRTGVVVLVGLSGASYSLPIVDTVLKGIQIRGSFLGTREDLDDVFALAASGLVKPHVATYPLDRTPSLLSELREGTLLGRAVVVFGT
ncbi:MAG: zinc-dependent alcohol dehydrogenase [Bryobacteraceae bacterium]